MYSTTVSNNVRFLKLSVPLEFGISEGLWGTTFLTFTSWLSAAAAAWMSTTTMSTGGPQIGAGGD